jgi:NADH-quinone oxidoreductase subunit J
MNPAIPYVACVVGAAAVYLLLKPANRAMKTAGVLLGLGAFAWLLIAASRVLAQSAPLNGNAKSDGLHLDWYFILFSAIAVASAVRMITHSRPVYAALYFVMVVLSSAGLFLILQAEFMAFALIIVYAGAILITYMFVLMLAQQAPSDGSGTRTAQPEYDRIPREPGMAATVGFIMLAVFTHMIFDGAGEVQPPLDIVSANAAAWETLEQMPKYAQEVVDRALPGARLAENWYVHVEDGTPWIDVIKPGEDHPSSLELPQDAFPSNVQIVGLDLVAKFPVSLELAGVILLLAMFGAVVLARKQIELGEDEVREAAGMRRLALHADDQIDYGPMDGGNVRGGNR